MILIILFVVFNFEKCQSPVPEGYYQHVANYSLDEIFHTYKRSNGYAYDFFGHLFFGYKTSFTKPIKLFLNPNAFFCKDATKNNLNIDLAFCIDKSQIKYPVDSNNRIKYMTFCYKPQLTSKNLRKEYSGYILSNVNKEVVDCGEEEHGFNIWIKRHPNTKIRQDYVEIQTSFDSNIYEFRLSEIENTQTLNRCFKIKLGTNDSVETKITNLDDKILVNNTIENGTLSSPVANQKNHLGNKTFWLLAMDFLPKRNNYYTNSHAAYYYAEFRYKSDYGMASYFESGGDCYTGDCLLGCTIIDEKTSEKIPSGTKYSLDKPKTYTYRSMSNQTVSLVIEAETKIDYENHGLNAKFFVSEYEHTWLRNDFNFEMKVNLMSPEIIYPKKPEDIKIRRSSSSNPDSETRRYVSKFESFIHEIYLECNGWKTSYIEKWTPANTDETDDSIGVYKDKTG